MKLNEAKQILKKNGFICEAAEFDAYDWLENNYMEMRRAAERLGVAIALQEAASCHGRLRLVGIEIG